MEMEISKDYFSRIESTKSTSAQIGAGVACSGELVVSLAISREVSYSYAAYQIKI